ncbi:MAG: retropepsin-like aspartic protease [Bacteroidota bacterium]
MFKVSIIALLTFFCQLSFAQEKRQTSSSQKKISIPFSLTEYNNLSVRAILNQKDTVQLMFHTAANDLTLTEDAIQKLKTIRFSNTTDSVKSWGGSANSSRLSKNNFVQIGGLSWENVPIWENKNSGQHTDGKFGIDLFANKVIEIDFDQKLINIYTELPKILATYQKLPLIFENDELFIEAECTVDKTIYKNKFLLHSGYSGAVLLDDKFANDNKLGERLKMVGEKSLKDSYGNIVKTKKAILPLLQIGKESLTDVPAGFFEGAIGRQKMSILGGDILKRFNWIIDAQRQFVYLKPGKEKTVAYTSF